MTKIERPRRAHFEGITAEPNLTHVELGASGDEMVQVRPGKACEVVGVGLQPVIKLGLAYQGNLHSFGHACSFFARRQYVDEGTVVDDRPRGSKATDEILQAELVDGVL